MLPLSAWPALDGLPARPLDGGLINTTYAVGEPPVAVVQRLHTIFAPEVNLDIQAVSAHLRAAGLLSPRVLSTGDGGLWTLDEEGRCWRALEWIPGHSVERLDEASMAAEAGRLVGRWHRATADLDYAFQFSRPGAHDTEKHMATLRQAVAEGAGHRLFSQVERLADGVLSAWEAWDGGADLAARVSHGDLKISNLRFDAEGRAICLLDLDTMGRLPLAIELGDAWRSWCNPRGEDVADAVFSLELFTASAGGYLAANPLSAEERAALVPGIERICLELAARFAADALNEAYFGWNPAVAAGRGEHNLLRARGQASLAGEVRGMRGALEQVLG